MAFWEKKRASSKRRPSRHRKYLTYFTAKEVRSCIETHLAAWGPCSFTRKHPSLFSAPPKSLLIDWLINWFPSRIWSPTATQETLWTLTPPFQLLPVPRTLQALAGISVPIPPTLPWSECNSWAWFVQPFTTKDSAGREQRPAREAKNTDSPLY